jgi:hypothetical protein
MRRLWIGLVANLALTAACGGGAEPENATPQEATVLEVDNQNALDMNVYVLRTSGSRERLGTATAHTRSRFTIPSRLIFGITPLRFQADPIGGRAAPVSQEITVQPGDTVVLRIPPG